MNPKTTAKPATTKAKQNPEAKADAWAANDLSATDDIAPGLTEDTPDESSRKIVAATRECLIHNGMRTTISDVARLSGLSRPTVYRKFSSLEVVIGETMTQELLGMLGTLEAPGSIEEFVETIVDTTERVRRNELMKSILREEPELLVTYQFHRLGRSQLAIIDVLERMLQSLYANKPASAPESSNPKHQALFILMLVQSVAFMANTVSEYFDDADWKQELRKMLKGYLQ